MSNEGVKKGTMHFADWRAMERSELVELHPMTQKQGAAEWRCPGLPRLPGQRQNLQRDLMGTRSGGMLFLFF